MLCSNIPVRVIAGAVGIAEFDQPRGNMISRRYSFVTYQNGFAVDAAASMQAVAKLGTQLNKGFM